MPQSLANEVPHRQIASLQRYPWIGAFVCGLLHGVGSASALAQIGLPPLSIPIALLFVNVGVEVGQFLFIMAVFSAIAIARHIMVSIRRTVPEWVGRSSPHVIGGLASYCVFERFISCESARRHGVASSCVPQVGNAHESHRGLLMRQTAGCRVQVPARFG